MFFLNTFNIQIKFLWVTCIGRAIHNHKWATIYTYTIILGLIT